MLVAMLLSTVALTVHGGPKVSPYPPPSPGLRGSGAERAPSVRRGQSAMLARTSARPFATPTARPRAPAQVLGLRSSRAKMCIGDPPAAVPPNRPPPAVFPGRASASPRGSDPQSNSATVTTPSYSDVKNRPDTYEALESLIGKAWMGYGFLITLGFGAWYDLRNNAGFATTSQVQVLIDSAGQKYLAIVLGVLVASGVLFAVGKAVAERE
jgi:hypothetical protein